MGFRVVVWLYSIPVQIAVAMAVFQWSDVRLTIANPPEGKSNVNGLHKTLRENQSLEVTGRLVLLLHPVFRTD